MSISKHFSLPYIGLKDGIHTFNFVANKDFFAEFPNSPIKDGSFEILLEVDKRPGLSEFNFDISGYANAVCDRCLADIKLPVTGTYRIIIKIGNSHAEDDEVIYIKDDESHIDLSQIVYEYICLSMPLVHVYDCASEIPRVCNDEILNKLNPLTEPEGGDLPNGKLWENFKNIFPEN